MNLSETTPSFSPPAKPPKDKSLLAFFGFSTGVVLALPAFATGYEIGVYVLLFDLFAVPVIAIVLSVIRKTRAFGLGLLLACLVGWLWLLALCGKTLGGI